MKQTLQLKLSQQLTLTPQLQQSIRLLQLSTLELNQELEKFLMENPLLERDDRSRSRRSPPTAPRARNIVASASRAPANDESSGRGGDSTGLPMHPLRPPGATTAKSRNIRNSRPAPPRWGSICWDNSR
jgi:DNA-directed RNA polymerase specialized sigma54-like protein